MGRWFGRSLDLSLDGVARHFRNPAELGALLAPRAVVSQQELQRLLNLGDQELVQQRRALEHLGGEFQAVLEAPTDAQAAGLCLLRLEPGRITPDQGWRPLVVAMQALDPAYEPYKRVVVDRYLDYVRSLKELLASAQNGRDDDAESPPGDPEERMGSSMNKGSGGRQRLSFSPDELLPATDGEVEFSRLPKGEMLEITLAPRQSLSLLLVKHRFLLVAGEPFLLIDDTGTDLRLAATRSIVGRSSQADVILDAEYRAVSRKHLIIERVDPATVRLTDISSLGTFVPSELLPKAQGLH